MRSRRRAPLGVCDHAPMSGAPSSLHGHIPPPELGSPAVRWMVIALVGAASLGCLAIPIANGGQPAIFLPIFICFSAAYVVAGAIGWTLRPLNPIGPLLLAIGLAGAFILLGATGLHGWGRHAGQRDHRHHPSVPDPVDQPHRPLLVSARPLRLRGAIRGVRRHRHRPAGIPRGPAAAPWPSFPRHCSSSWPGDGPLPRGPRDVRLPQSR